MDNKDFIRVSEGHFTPYSYVPTNPALRGLGLRMPQLTPEQESFSPRSFLPWLSSRADAFKRDLKDVLRNPVDVLERNVDYLESQFKRDPVETLLASSNLGGIAGLGIIGKVPAEHWSKASQGASLGRKYELYLLQKDIEKMQRAIKKNPAEWQNQFVHDPVTGRNYFQDMRGELLVEYPDVVKGKGQIGKEPKETHPYVFTDTPYHPDKEAMSLLSGTRLYVSPSNTGSSYTRPHTVWNTDMPGRIDVKAAEKKYLVSGSEWDALTKQMDDLYNSDIPIAERNIKLQELRKQRDELTARLDTAQESRTRLKNAFTASVVAHEGSHGLQYITGLPGGGSPQVEARRIFEETIGSDPKKLAEYELASNLAESWLAQEPLQLMVALTRMQPNKTTYDKYVKMLYAEGNERATNKFFKKVDIKDKQGNIIGTDFEPDKQKILNEVFVDIHNNRLNVAGTSLEPWAKMSEDAFSAYKHKYGEAYSRIAQKRAFQAASGKNENVYKTNPQGYFDVDPQKITYP